MGPLKASKVCNLVTKLFLGEIGVYVVSASAIPWKSKATHIVSQFRPVNTINSDGKMSVTECNVKMSRIPNSSSFLPSFPFSFFNYCYPKKE